MVSGIEADNRIVVTKGCREGLCGNCSVAMKLIIQDESVPELCCTEFSLQLTITCRVLTHLLRG